METNREGIEGILNENGNDSNVTTSPAASNSSVKSTRDINDVVEHPPTNDEQGGDEDDESSSCSEEEDTSEDEDSVDDPHLSEYGKMVILPFIISPSSCSIQFIIHQSLTSLQNVFA